jgi:hypothetical protein
MKGNENMKSFMVFFTLNYLNYHMKIRAVDAEQAKFIVKGLYPTAKRVRAKPALLG